MTKNLSYLVVYCLAVMFFSCNPESLPIDRATDESLSKAMNIVKESKLPVLLAELKSNDQVKVNEYTSLLATVSDKIAKDWKLPLAKLVINSYVRSNGLDENSYTSYLYQDQKLAVAYSVPEHVKDSFDRTFLCRSPDYWKQLPAREKAITSPVDTLNKEMRFEIVMLK